jgi:hypothetical protein
MLHELIAAGSTLFRPGTMLQVPDVDYFGIQAAILLLARQPGQ